MCETVDNTPSNSFIACTISYTFCNEIHRCFPYRICFYKITLAYKVSYTYSGYIYKCVEQMYLVDTQKYCLYDAATTITALVVGLVCHSISVHLICSPVSHAMHPFCLKFRNLFSGIRYKRF